MSSRSEKNLTPEQMKKIKEEIERRKRQAKSGGRLNLSGVKR